MKTLATTLALLMSLASAVDLRTRDAYLTGAEPLSDLAQSDRQEEIDTTLAQTKTITGRFWKDDSHHKWFRQGPFYFYATVLRHTEVIYSFYDVLSAVDNTYTPAIACLSHFWVKELKENMFITIECGGLPPGVDVYKHPDT